MLTHNLCLLTIYTNRCGRTAENVRKTFEKRLKNVRQTSENVRKTFENVLVLGSLCLNGVSLIMANENPAESAVTADGASAVAAAAKIENNWMVEQLDGGVSGWTSIWNLLWRPI